MDKDRLFLVLLVNLNKEGIMGDVTKPTIVRVKVTFSDGKVEEFNFEDIKIPDIKTQISLAIDKAIAYLKAIGADRYK